MTSNHPVGQQITKITSIAKPVSDTTLPMYTSFVTAGFPSPADDYLEGSIDLNKYLISNSAATFLVRVVGDSMVGAGIFSDDVLVVDRSKDPKSGDVIVAIIEGEFTVKRFLKENGVYILRPENPDFEDIVINQELGFQVWGVVNYVLHNPNQNGKHSN